MAVCDACQQEMTKGTSCTLEAYDGESNPRVRYSADEKEPCHDCRCPPGGLHHPGCDNEVCPQCGGQCISCKCDGQQ